MKRTGLVAIACVLAGLAAPAAAAEELGRLFFTPQQRAELEARRKARIPDKPTAPVIESPVTTVNGYVQRSGGRSTVWINGQPIPQGTQPEGTHVYPGASPSRVGVGVAADRRRFELEVGQSVERDTGKVKGLLNGGEIVVGQPPPAPPRGGR